MLSLDTVNNIFLTARIVLPEVVVALINSKLASWFAYRFIYNQAIRTMHFDSEYVGRLRLPPIEPQTQKNLAELVHLRMDCKREEKARAIECEIDEILYSCFNLTEGERDLISKSTF